jgi:hypothetical protein
MLKNIIRGCCIVSVVLGAVCSGGALEAMRPEVSCDNALAVITSILARREKVPALDILRWARELCVPRINVSLLFEGNDLVKGLIGNLISGKQPYSSRRGLFFRPLIEFRQDSEELRALDHLFSSLEEDETKTEEDALHDSVMCYRMLSDPNKTVGSVFAMLLDIGYSEMRFSLKEDPERLGPSRWDIVSAIARASVIIRSSQDVFEIPVLDKDINDATNLIWNKCSDISDWKYSEDVKFLAAMDLLDGSDIAFSDAVFLADAIISDPLSATVCEYYRRKASAKARGEYGVFCLDMPLRDPSLVATTRMVRTMLGAEVMFEAGREMDYTDLDTLDLIFHVAKTSLGLEVEDVADLWISVTNSNSEQVKESIIILNLMNEYLRSQFIFSEICEVAMGLVSARTGLKVARAYLSDYSNLDTLDLISHVEKIDCSLKIENVADFLTAAINSEQISEFLIILNLMFDSPGMQEVAMNLVSAKIGLEVARAYLSEPNVCNPLGWGNFLHRLSQKGIELRSSAEIEAYENEMGITEERRFLEDDQQNQEVFLSALQNLLQQRKEAWERRW